MYLLEDEEPPRTWRRKKATRKWCKGKVGRPHQPVAVYSRYNNAPICYPYKNTIHTKWWWRNVIDDIWVCEHRLDCAKCGKNLEWRVSELEDCPTWREL